MKLNRKYSMRCFNAVVELVGSRKKLAGILGLSPRTIHDWAYRGEINPKYVIDLVRLSEGKFSAEELLGKFDSVDGENELND